MKIDEVRNMLSSRLAFGTAGIRGVMRTGYSGLNDLVIIQTSQGLCQYILNYYGSTPEIKSQGIVIGYDGRHNSKRFAERTAVAFLSQGVKVYLFQEIVPTPFIPFTIKKLKTLAGVVVTASHNPKDDNGYKVYFHNGSQIISPHDKGIQECILKNLKPWPKAWDTDLLTQVVDPIHTTRLYFDRIKETNTVVPQELILKTDLKFTYTSLHGVGHKWLTIAFETCGFRNYYHVPEQSEPDPEFPTVKFPNPEEGEGVLDLSFKVAEANGSTIIIANDPDVDRCAVAEKQPDGSWRCLNGNEIGALLSWWCLHSFKQKKGSKPDMKDCYMITTAVSSKIPHTIAKKEGFHFIETLTGFKWIGNKVDELTKNGKMVLFAFEEAIGFMVDPATLPDKDGISAALQIACMAVYLRHCFPEPRGLVDQISHIFQEYGYHTSLNSYFICHEKSVIDSIFHKMSNPYPTHLGPYKISRIRDLNTGFDSGYADKKAILPTSKSSYMITFWMENGIILTIRTSGTEPKIKYYTEAIGAPGESNWSEMDVLLADVVDKMIVQCLEPQKHGLKPKN